MDRGGWSNRAVLAFVPQLFGGKVMAELAALMVVV
jgi:hypothetical protein